MHDNTTQQVDIHNNYYTVELHILIHRIVSVIVPMIELFVNRCMH